MSVRVMNLVWERAPYSGGTLLVLLALADWSDDEGFCWPKVQTLAVKARLSDRQSQRALRDLANAGILNAQRRGRYDSCLYAINVDALETFPLVKETRANARGDKMSPLKSGVTFKTPRGDTRVTQDPSEDPSIREESDLVS
jgi:hypothetical protein